MLQSIHDSAKGWLAWVIVILISIPFALWGIHEYLRPTPKKVVAEINGVELLESDFQQQLQQRQQRIRAIFQNQAFDMSFMNTPEFRQGVLKDMIEREVLFQSAIDAGMRIGDATLASHIHKIPAFQQDNQFSAELYKQVLSNQGLPQTVFEQEMRRDILMQQFQEGVLRSTVLTDYDEQQRTRLEQQQRYLTYLIIPIGRFQETITPTAAEIDEEYKKPLAQYNTPEQVSLEYVELSQNELMTKQSIDEKTLTDQYEERKASFTTIGTWKVRHILLKADGSAIEAAKKKAQELLVKIRAGEAFEELAKQFSDDPGSRNQGGDLSWIGLKAMPNKDFQDAVQALKKGEVSEPVVTQEGVHLIKVEDSQPEVIRSFAEVRGQLEMELKKEKALSEFNAQVDQFATLAYENPSSLAVVAGTLNLPIKTTGLFSRNDSHPKDSIFTNAKIVEAAFSQQVLKDRYNSDLIEIGEQQVVVIRIKDYVESKRKPLEEVKAEITTKLKQQKAQVEAQTLGKRLLEQLKQTSDSDSVVKAQNLSWSIPQWVERQDTRLKQPKIVSEAFKAGYPAKDKAIYQGMELENGDYALVAVLAVKDGIIIPTTASNPQSPSSKERQQQALGESEFNQLTEGLKVSAKIKEYSNKVLVEQNPG